MMANPKSLFILLFNVINQYDNRNIEFKVFYHGMVMSILIWIIIFIYIQNNIVALLHCYLYSHYRYQRTCDVIAPNAPSQEVGHWSAIILHTVQAFIALTPAVLVKISAPNLPLRPAIIDNALDDNQSGGFSSKFVFVTSTFSKFGFVPTE